MSASDALQAAIHARLTGDAALSALIGSRIHDLPPAPVTAPYVSYGPSTTVPLDAECIAAREETLQIDVWSEAQDGYREAKTICDAIKGALHEADLDLGTHALAQIRIAAMRVFRDPDGRTTHGVLTVQAVIEEG